MLRARARWPMLARSRSPAMQRANSFERLSKRGANAQHTLREQAQKLANRLRRQAARPPRPAGCARAGPSFLAKGRDQLLDRLQIPTQASLAELNEIERLSAAIDDLRVKSRRQAPFLWPSRCPATRR